MADADGKFEKTSPIPSHGAWAAIVFVSGSVFRPAQVAGDAKVDNHFAVREQEKKPEGIVPHWA
ncbi:hypothetical protein E4U51_007122 [Claviceps purpurea]|nr:hypothetical protein E4U51_007122 [Claviceps purpurea]